MSLATTDAMVQGEDATAAMRAAFERQKAAFTREPFPSLQERLGRLERLMNVLQGRRADLERAISEDFGHRSRHETLLADVFVPIAAMKYVAKNLKSWMRPESRPVSLALRPATAKVVPQPLGVVGIVSPWNYPVQLALVPLAYALAAGNRALLKPSELTPRTSALMAEMLATAFPSDLVAVVLGGPDVGAAFVELPFDHLVYTGSTRIGRLVMAAAAKNLTPVTLELGGKSPALVHPDYPIDRAAEAIAGGKLFNAGQTCVAPDYVLVQRGKADALCDAIARQVAKLYPRLVDNADYTSIVNDRHKGRLKSYLTDAAAKGAQLVELNPAGESFEGSPKLAPVLVRRPTEDMVVMQDEIFGPILPIVEVDGLDAGLRYINEHPRPLALYYFDNDETRIERVLRTTHAGGVTLNECMLHVAEEHLPFGGVGPSGMGAYHGREGFDALSHRKAVFRQPRINGRWLILPPFGARVERLVDWLL